MPADVSFENVATHEEAARASRRLPLGFGLAIGACASLSLWVGVAMGLRALFS
jgi:hypothetical protein